MVYVNKPKPSKGFVSFFILVFLVFLGVLSIIAFILLNFNSETSIITFDSITIAIFGPALFVAFVAFYTSVYIIGPSLLLSFVASGILASTPMLIFLGIFIHGAYNTEYRIEDGILMMKFGHLPKEFVSLDEIKGIEKVDFIRGNWRFSFHNRSYCNRLKNGVGIITEYRTIWVSPEDSEKFVSKLGLKTGR